MQVLVCPSDGGSLTAGGVGIVCSQCGNTYAIRENRIYFTEPLQSDDVLDNIKEKAKRLLRGTYHTIFRPLFAPAFPYPYRRYVLKHCDPASEIVVDIGSGNVRLHPDVYSLDGFDYENTDIVCDMRRLPFRDSSVDAFVSSSVLEHIKDIAAVLSQLARATRAGGQSIHIIPFMYPYHASPDDYQRFTHEGARMLLGRDWSTVRQVAAAGPFTLFNALATDILSSFVSLGSARVKAFSYLVISALLAPLKFLDFPFIGRPWLMSSCPVILTHLQKVDRSRSVR